MVFDCDGNEDQFLIPYRCRPFYRRVNHTKDTADFNKVFVLHCSILVHHIDCIAIQSEVVSISCSLLVLMSQLFCQFGHLFDCLSISGPIAWDQIVPDDSVNNILLVNLNHGYVIMISQEGVLSVELTVALAVARNKHALIIVGIMVVLVCCLCVNSTHKESTIIKTCWHYLVEPVSSFMPMTIVHHLCHYFLSIISKLVVIDIVVMSYFKINLNFGYLLMIITFLLL